MKVKANYLKKMWALILCMCMVMSSVILPANAEDSNSAVKESSYSTEFEDAKGSSMKYANGSGSRWSFVTIDDSSFKGNVTAKDSIEFWAYLEKSSGGDWTSVTLALVQATNENAIRGDVTLTVGQWTKISLNRSEIQKYIDANNGLRIRTTVNGGNNMSFNLYIDDFQVVKDGNKSVADNYTSSNGTISTSTSILHNADTTTSAKYVNNVGSRWSFIKIDDSSFKGSVTADDSIEFWVYLEKSNGGDWTSIRAALVQATNETAIRGDVSIPVGTWTKISLNASQMQKYIDANNGLRMRVTVDDGNTLGYNLYFDDFKVVKGANKVRYSSTNGTVEQTTSVTQGSDGSVATKYVNGQWSRWSFVNIDDSDLADVTSGDRIEFWIMYEKLATSDFTNLTVNLLNKSDQNTSFSGEITLTAGTWTKISLTAAQMQKYIDRNDGMRLRLTVDGGSNYLWYNLYIDDFQVVYADDCDNEISPNYSGKSGTFSASSVIHSDNWSGKTLTTQTSTDSESASLVNVSGTYNGAWLKYNGLNFDAFCADQILVRYSNSAESCKTDATLEFYLDSMDTEPIATVDLAETGDMADYAIASASINSQISGTHNVYVKMTGTEGSGSAIANLDWFSFETFGIKYQTRVNQQGNIDARLITYVDTLAYQDVSFNITYMGQTVPYSCDTVYEKIVAADVTIDNANEVFGNEASYFVTLTVTNIPTDVDVAVSVTWTDLDGNQVTSEQRVINVPSGN